MIKKKTIVSGDQRIVFQLGLGSQCCVFLTKIVANNLNAVAFSSQSHGEQQRELLAEIEAK